MSARKHRAPSLSSSPDLGAWAKAEKPKWKKNTGIASSSMTSATAEAERRGDADDWEGTKPLVFVAAYARLHELVYGLSPAELGPQERKLAAFAAGRMLRHDFEGSATTMAAFVAWAWQREQGREKWRRANGRQGFRLTWRLLFGSSLVTDMRLEQLRSKGSR